MCVKRKIFKYVMACLYDGTQPLRISHLENKGSDKVKSIKQVCLKIKCFFFDVYKFSTIKISHLYSYENQ